jgi:dsRNA-specific ribonuclease
VVVGDAVLAQGAGRTKKEAEQEGARLALAEITKVE